ncbi:MAG TPA: TolC family protein [Verrucomicrobiae bacterium]|nr:TolC family protein [Verrucomicrobiae bacterium]
MKNLYLFALLCLVVAAHGADMNTLSILVDEALRQNPELKFYEAEIAAAKANRKHVGTWANPELSADGGRMRMVGDEGVAWSVSVMQPFEWPGRLGLRKAIANGDIELAQIGLERFRVALTSRVRSAGYNVYAADQKARAVREVAERLRLLRDVLVQRDAAGITPLLETRVIEAMDISMQRKASEAAIQKQIALFELNQLRGMPVSESLSVSAPSLKFLPAPDSEALRAAALTNNFELRMRVVELSQSGLRVSLARNERFPRWSIGPQYSEQRVGDQERMLLVGVSLPLPLWNRNAGNIGAAEAKQLQAETALRVAQREVERKVAEAAARYQAKVDEINKSRVNSIEHFRDAADLADRHYRLGAVPVATYIELQKQYLDAVEALLETRKEAVDAAQELQLLTGMAQDLLQQP